MYERLLNQAAIPWEDDVRKCLGTESSLRLLAFEHMLNDCYDLKRELKFPFGSHYGWGYQYRHKSAHLCYAFFESGSFTVTLQIGDSCVPAVEQLLPNLSEKANQLWKNRYPCGAQGGWIHDRVLEDRDLTDILALIKVKKRPLENRKK